jgi:AraC family transcriptional activator of pobA
VDVDAIDCGLHARFWSFNGSAGDVQRQLVFVSDGAGEIETGQHRFIISAPALLWLGDLQPGRLRMDAGATGLRARMTDRTVVDAIGDDDAALALRYLVDRDFSLSLAGHPEAMGAIERCLNAVAAERRQPGQASAMLLSALLRLVLVSILRISAGQESAFPGPGESMTLLRRFRQLVEINFRNHWPVARYADALGVTPDRLHAVCSKGIGKSPKALLSERLAHEAMLRLERSGMTIQQLGHSLGYSDPAHFSNFFRKMRGVSPGRYRRSALEARAEGRKPPEARFADWP